MDISDIVFQMDNFTQWLELSTSKPSMQELLRFFRQTRNSKFLELCRVHLSFLLDSPQDYLDGQEDFGEDLLLQEPVGSEKKQFFRNLLAKLFKRNKDTNKTLADGGSVIDRLIKHLMCHHGTLVEGVFRKAGNLNKQKQLKKQLTSDLASYVDFSQHSIHDLACILKNLLLDWPLLSDEIRRVFIALSPPDRPETNEPSEDTPTASHLPEIPGYNHLLDRLSLAKRKKGYRLLCLLMPDVKRELFLNLLRLLNRVAHSPVTLMTPDTLGTLFGPLLLASPRESSATLRDKYRSYGVVMRDLISMAADLDEIPISLLVDIESNMNYPVPSHVEIDFKNNGNKSEISSKISPTKTEVLTRKEDPALHTCVRFAMSPSRRQTDQELGQLIGVIHDMPDASDNKRRYLRRLNRTVQSRSPYPEKSIRTPNSRLIEDNSFGKRRTGMKRFLSSCISKSHISNYEVTQICELEKTSEDRGFKRWRSQCGILDVSTPRMSLDGEDSSSIESLQKFQPCFTPRKDLHTSNLNSQSEVNLHISSISTGI